MEAALALIPVIGLVVGLLAAFAVFRLPAILTELKKQTKILKDILKAIETSDANRREEFEATASEEAVA